jgi:hypothetical protein
VLHELLFLMLYIPVLPVFKAQSDLLGLKDYVQFIGGEAEK